MSSNHARRSLFIRAAAAAVATALFCTPTVARAQFSKLKDLGSKVAKDAAKDAAGKKADAATGGAATANANKDSRGESAYVINNDRISAVLAVMAPLRADAERRSKARGDIDAFRVKRQAFDSCAKKGLANPTNYTPDNAAKAAPMSEKTTAMLQKYAALMQVPDAQTTRRREIAFLEDSMAVLGTQAQLTTFGVSCGAPAYKPAFVIDADLSARASGEGNFDVPESMRAGMSATQFGMVRERIALWSLIQIGAAKPTEGRFSDAESAALTARADEIKALAPYFRDGSLHWVNWADLRTW